MTDIAIAPGPRRHQAAPAGDLGERRLPHDRDPDPDQFRAPDRVARRPLDRAGARRRDRQRQRGPRGRPARLHGHRHRLRPGAARTSPAAAAAEGRRGRVHRGRRRGAPVRGRQLRRRRPRSSARCSRPTRSRRPRELARVTRPGGRIGLVAHTPEGFIGNLFKVIAPSRPAAGGAPLADPVGHRGPAPRAVRRLDRRACSVQKRHFVFRYRSPEAYVDYWRRYYGPTLKAFEAVGEAGRGGARGDLLDLIARFNRADDGTMVVPSEYLEAVIVTN